MPATDDFDIDEAAAMDFGEPAGPELLEQFEAVAWDRECSDAGVDLRIAAVMLEKSKEELIAFARGLGQAAVEEELGRLFDRQKQFSDLAALLESAAGRLMIAGAVCCVADRRPRPVEGFGPIL